MSVSFEGNYNIDPCNKTKMSSLKLALIQKLQTATCVKSGSCTLAVSATKCDLRRRKKRSQPTSVSITLSFAVDGTNLETTLEMLLVNKTGICLYVIGVYIYANYASLQDNKITCFGQCLDD